MNRHDLEPWWMVEHGPDVRMAPGIDGMQPLLVGRDAMACLEEMRRRMPGFTWDWRPRGGGDAGLAIAGLVAAQQALVGERLDRLPARLRIGFLRMAGVEPRPATPARAVVAFEVATGARRAVRVPEGFRVTAPPVDGEGDVVSFETTRTLFAQPARLEQVFMVDGDTLLPSAPISEDPEQGFAPFPERATDGAWLIGLAVSPTAELRPRLTLGVRLAARTDAPPPASASLAEPTAPSARPLLRWEALDRDRFIPLEVVRDETRELSRSGLVELGLPARWRPGTHAGLEEPLHWLRARVIAGRFARRPVINRLWLNAAEVQAVRTIRDEPLEPLGARVFRLRLGPVRPGSVVIEVDERGLVGPRRWSEVPDLSLYGPTDRVYRVDLPTGRVHFGDGVHGAALPADRGPVVALRYQVGADAGSGVIEGSITTLADSAPFLIGVDNPFPASGGRDAETQAAARRRGPALFRARGRAVSPADYELLALAAPGARIERAHAVDGHDPGRPGCPIPGAVGVFVVPPDRGGGPPVPSEDDLRAVSRYLAETVAPAGVRVITAAPRFHTVRVEASVLVDPVADTGTVVGAILEELDRWLHPLTGGSQGRGWPFGGTVEHLEIRARIDAVDGVFGVTRLSLIVDGIRLARCTDHPIPPFDLVWPGAHEIIPEVAP